jgi:hypothetical protein
MRLRPYQRAKVQQCRTGLALVAQNMPRRVDHGEHRTPHPVEAGAPADPARQAIAAPLPLELGSAELHPG